VPGCPPLKQEAPRVPDPPAFWSACSPWCRLPPPVRVASLDAAPFAIWIGPEGRQNMWTQEHSPSPRDTPLGRRESADEADNGRTSGGGGAAAMGNGTNHAGNRVLIRPAFPCEIIVHRQLGGHNKGGRFPQRRVQRGGQLYIKQTRRIQRKTPAARGGGGGNASGLRGCGWDAPGTGPAVK